MKINPLIRQIVSVFALLVLSTQVSAEIRLNGFASIRATTADSDNGTPPYDWFKGDGDHSFKDESLFAIQASADLGEGLTATVQMMARGVDEFDVKAQWAYLSYELNDQHTLSAGKLVNPIFFQSQYERVGFAHNFARLPSSVYQDFSFSTIEGISLDSIYLIGDYSLETKLTYGNWDGSIFSPALGFSVTAGLQDILSANVTFSGDWWKVYVGGFITEFEGGSGSQDDIILASVQPAIDAAIAIGASDSDLAIFNSAVVVDGDEGQYVFTGFSVDKNNILLDAEYVQYGVDGYLTGDTKGWYVALGYRMGQSVFSLHKESLVQYTSFKALQGITNPILLGTGQALSESLVTTDNSAVGVTWRYDFHPSAALKVDYLSGENKQIDIGDYSIWSVGVDLVF